MREFRTPPASSLAHLSGSDTQKEIVKTFRSLLVQAGATEQASDFKDKTFPELGSLTFPKKHLDRAAASGVVELQQAVLGEDWEKVWNLSNELLDELALSGKPADLAGLDQLNSPKARYLVVFRWLVFVCAVAEEKLRPLDVADDAYDFLDDPDDFLD